MVRQFRRSTDLQRARLDPSAVFAGPEEVLGVPDLTRAERLEILRRWAYQVDQPVVPDEEEAYGGEPVLPDRIRAAMDLLESEAGDQP